MLVCGGLRWSGPGGNHFYRSSQPIPEAQKGEHVKNSRDLEPAPEREMQYLTY
jgi:hypothetical protein